MKPLLPLFYLLLIISCTNKKSNLETKDTSLKDSLVYVNMDVEIDKKRTLSAPDSVKAFLREYKILERLKKDIGLRVQLDARHKHNHITGLMITETPFHSFIEELYGLTHLSRLSLISTGIESLTPLEKFEKLESLWIRDRSLSDTINITNHWSNLEFLAIHSSNVKVLTFPKENKLKKLVLYCNLSELDSSFFYLKDLEDLELITSNPDIIQAKIDTSHFKKLKKYYVSAESLEELRQRDIPFPSHL